MVGRILAVVLSVLGVLFGTLVVLYLLGSKVALVAFFVLALLAGGVILLVFLLGQGRNQTPG